MHEQKLENWVNSVGHQLADHRKSLFRILIGVLVVGLLLGAWIYWWNQKEKGAQIAGFDLLQMEEKAEFPKDFQKLSEAYEEGIFQFGKTKSGRILYFRYAKLLAQNQKYDQALKQYKKFLKYFSLTSPYRALTLWNMAHCAEQLDQLEEAKNFLIKANGIDANPQKEFILFSLARISEKLGETAKAKEYYESIINDYPGSPLGPRVKERQLALMKGQKKAEIKPQ